MLWINRLDQQPYISFGAVAYRTCLLYRNLLNPRFAQCGWNIFLTAWTAGDIANPLSMAMLNAKGQNGWFGWQDEPRLEYLKGRFARTTEVAEKKKIASEIQRVAFETATHAPLGQYISPAALRSNVSGMLVTPGVPVLWNMKKN